MLDLTVDRLGQGIKEQLPVNTFFATISVCVVSYRPVKMTTIVGEP